MRKFIEKDPDFFDTYLALADFLHEDEEYFEADELLRTAFTRAFTKAFFHSWYNFPFCFFVSCMFLNQPLKVDLGIFKHFSTFLIEKPFRRRKTALGFSLYHFETIVYMIACMVRVIK